MANRIYGTQRVPKSYYQVLGVITLAAGRILDRVGVIGVPRKVLAAGFLKDSRITPHLTTSHLDVSVNLLPSNNRNW